MLVTIFPLLALFGAHRASQSLSKRDLTIFWLFLITAFVFAAAYTWLNFRFSALEALTGFMRDKLGISYPA
ncbi:MAG: hypothetical protein QM689_11585 [Oscillospiraceae bacterium]